MAAAMDVVRPKPGLLSGRRGRGTALRVGVVLSAIALVAFAVRAIGIARADQATAVERSSVLTDVVRRGDLLRQVPAQGTLVPEHVTWLSATSAGRVARIAVRPGAEVEPDTVVLVLANADLELAALEADRAAATAEAALVSLDVKSDADNVAAAAAAATLRRELAHANDARATADRLADAGLLSGLERADTTTKAAVLGDRLTGEEARMRVLTSGRARQLAAQRTEVARLRDIAAFARGRVAALEVRAGTRGIVQDIALESGQWVAVGAQLARIAEPGRLKGDLRVSEAEAADVRRGLPVRFEHGGATFRGRVERVDPAVAKGTVRLEVLIDDALPPGVRADQAATAWIEIETLTNVLHVARPAGALPRVRADVFRVSPDGRGATRTTVQLGRASAREIEIASGLAEGDTVVVSDVAVPSDVPHLRFK